MSTATFTYPPDDSRYSYKGRWELDDHHHSDYSHTKAVADWPCSSVQFSFTVGADAATTTATTATAATTATSTTHMKLMLSMLRVRLNVEVTNQETNVVESSTVLEGPQMGHKAPQEYDLLLENLTPGTSYTLTLKKLTQAAPYNNGIGNIRSLQSVLEFHGLTVTTHEATRFRMQAPVSEFDRRVALIGASDTAGFCVDGTPETTDAMMKPWKYDNCDQTSHAVLGRRLQADTTHTAIAGIGLTQNAFANMPFLLGKRTMPEFYQRTLQTKKHSQWNHLQWRPDLVVVSLGGNDFNHQKHVPSNETFVQAYHQFLSDIAQPYLDQGVAPPTLVSICGQGDPTEHARDPNNDRCRPCPHVQAATKSFAQQQDRIPVHYIYIPCDGTVVTGVDDIGCEGHKNRLGQERVANFLEPQLREIMGWQDEEDDESLSTATLTKANSASESQAIDLLSASNGGGVTAAHRNLVTLTWTNEAATNPSLVTPLILGSSLIVIGAVLLLRSVLGWNARRSYTPAATQPLEEMDCKA